MKREVIEVIFHHSGSDNPDHDNLATIREWHLARGWKGEGYHYYVRKSGLVELGRPLRMVGAHCKHKNSKSIGLCLGGNHVFSDEQFHSAVRLVYDLKSFYPDIEIKAHKDYGATDCPRYSNNIIKERLHGLETLSTASMGWWHKESLARICKENRQ
jgi:hypothetical protein